MERTQEAPETPKLAEGPNNSESASERGEARPSPKLELTVEEVIEQHVGSLGFAQILHALVVSLAWIFDAQTTLISIFTDAQPAARLLPAQASGKANVEGSLLCGLDPGAWEWVEGKRSSIVAEWNLICDHKFLAAVPASVFFIGSLFGSVVYGYLADSFLGRKRTLLLSCVLTFVTAFSISFSPNIWVYALLRCANGFFRSGIGSCCIVLATEIAGRKWRGQVGQYGFFFFTTGFLSLPIMAYFVRTWRTLYKIISFLPLGYSLLLLPFAFESPRWLLVKGRNKEAMDILRTLAKLNGKKLPTDLSLVDPRLGADETSGENKEKLWKAKWALKRVVMVMLAGFGTGFVYYGMQLNAENLNFNLYLTVAMNALMEIPAVFIGSILLGIMNRRPLFSNSSYIAGISCVLCAVLSIKRITQAKAVATWLQLVVEAIGFMASSTAYDVLYVYCVELFPTNVRNFAVSLLRQAFMLGASAVPLLVALGRVSPLLSFMFFGVVSILSGVLSLWLQETRNAPLYDTLKQQEKEENLRGQEIGIGAEGSATSG